jgi:hypothetical protein
MTRHGFLPKGPASTQGDRLTIVTVCMNRRNHLRLTAPKVASWSWHHCHLIVDWSSDLPLLREELPDDPRIRLERIEGEREWCIARAYNAAIQLTDADWILKCDADCWPTQAWREPLHQLDAGTISIGEGASGRNGQFLMARQTFLHSGGFHELMQGWGFEDKDLRLRLQRIHGCQLLPLPLEALGVIDHDDALRAGLRTSTPGWSDTHAYRRSLSESRIRASMLANRLTAALAPWSGETAACLYQWDQGSWTLVPGSLPQLPKVAKREIDDARRIVFWARFLAIPEVLIEQMPFSLFPAWRTDSDVRWWHKIYWYGIRWLPVMLAQLLSFSRILFLRLLGKEA